MMDEEMEELIEGYILGSKSDEILYRKNPFKKHMDFEKQLSLTDLSSEDLGQIIKITNFCRSKGENYIRHLIMELEKDDDIY